MKNKIMIINGSPRENSNTRFVSSIIAQSAQNNGAFVDEIDATKIKFNIPGCSGCGKCHITDDFTCIIDDELAQKVSKLRNYDTIVIATPIYWMSYSAQIKMVIDRMGSYMKFDENGNIQTPLKGKSLAIVATGNAGMENNLTLLEQQFENMAYMLSCKFHSCLFPNTPLDADITKGDLSIREKAEKFGKLLTEI